jgi:hypothetical protein
MAASTRRATDAFRYELDADGILVSFHVREQTFKHPSLAVKSGVAAFEDSISLRDLLIHRRFYRRHAEFGKIKGIQSRLCNICYFSAANTYQVGDDRRRKPSAGIAKKLIIAAIAHIALQGEDGNHYSFHTG